LIFLILLFLLGYCYTVTQKPPLITLSGSHVIITGGSSGIGLELALELTSRGSHVTILARDEIKLKEAHKRMELERKSPTQNLLYFSCDVGSYPALSVAIKSAATQNGQKIDVLICSAGVTHVVRFLESPPTHIDRVMNINFNGCAYATYAVAPYMQEQKKRKDHFLSPRSWD